MPSSLLVFMSRARSPEHMPLVVLVQELDPDRQADNICTVHVERSRLRHQRFSKGRSGVAATHGGAATGISAVASNYMGVFESM